MRSIVLIAALVGLASATYFDPVLVPQSYDRSIFFGDYVEPQLWRRPPYPVRFVMTQQYNAMPLAPIRANVGAMTEAPKTEAKKKTDFLKEESLYHVAKEYAEKIKKFENMLFIFVGSIKNGLNDFQLDSAMLGMGQR
ncbi:unnamed protein product [Hermetia illucens]|uniref:Uncharacterized protein n=1 Tax=Hermetia illucens TaxID=343691 RepID=A0A7R8UIV0_HERIL|nr:unnamed protein product [Hermetia illucens]